MNGKLAFVGRFLALFALLIILGWAAAAPARYAALLRDSARVISPVTHGWWLETRATARGEQLWFRQGDREVRLLLNLESLSLGLLPLLALLGATPGLGWKRWALSAVIGSGAFFAFDLLVVWIYPILVSTPNPLTDITGMFLGLLIFVGAPVILWFILTFDRLRAIWQLGENRERRRRA